jgi:hypothetical protein
MIERITPRKLNKDTDERSLKPSELKDAMNVSVGIDSEGDSGVLKLADGNDYVSLSDAMASLDGVKTVIGSVEDEELGVIYFFVHNSNGNHAIYAYSSKTNTYRLIFSHPSLNFSSNGFVKGDVVRVKRRFAAEAASILGEQGEDGGAIDFGGGSDDPIFTDPAVAIELDIVRDLVIFEELARNVYDKFTFQTVFDVANDWEMTFYCQINGGLSSVPMFPSESEALDGANGVTEISTKGIFSTDDLGFTVSFSYGTGALVAGGGETLVPELWLKSSDFNDPSFEMFVELRYVGEGFQAIGTHSKQSSPAGGTMYPGKMIEPYVYTEVINLTAGSFVQNVQAAGRLTPEIDPTAGVLYTDNNGAGYQKVFGKPERTKMNITVTEVFEHEMLGYDPNSASNLDAAIRIVRDQMKSLGTNVVQPDGTSLPLGPADPLLIDRSCKVSTRVSFQGALKSYTEDLVDFVYQLTDGGPNDWVNGGQTIGFRPTDDGGGGGTDPSNIYAVVWCKSSCQFRLFYCNAANYVPTESFNPALNSTDGTWGFNSPNAYAEVQNYCGAPQSTAGINTAANWWTRITYNLDAPNFESYTQLGPGSDTWITSFPGEFSGWDTTVANNLPYGLRFTVSSHYESVSGNPLIDPTTERYNAWVLFIDSENMGIGAPWLNGPLALDNDTAGKDRQFYLNSLPASNVVQEEFPEVFNETSPALETQESFLSGIGIDDRLSFKFITYLSQLDYLTYNINYPLGFAISNPNVARRSLIVNYEWDGRDNNLNLSLLKVEPIDSSLGNETELKAWELGTTGSEFALFPEIAYHSTDPSLYPAFALNSFPVNYQFTLANGQSDSGLEGRGIFVPLKRFEEENDYLSTQIGCLAPIITSETDISPNGDLRYGPYSDNGNVLPFAWGTLVSEASAGNLPAGRGTIPASDERLVVTESDSGESSTTGEDQGGVIDVSSTETPEKDSDTTDSQLSLSSRLAKKTIRKKY